MMPSADVETRAAEREPSGWYGRFAGAIASAALVTRGRRSERGSRAPGLALSSASTPRERVAPMVSDHRLERLIARLAPGHSLMDVGCLSTDEPARCTLALESGATSVLGVDLVPETPEFIEIQDRSRGRLDFLQGDLTDHRVLARAGEVDVVVCVDLLEYHPRPLDLLRALRRACRGRLVLRVACIGDGSSGDADAAWFWPAGSARSNAKRSRGGLSANEKRRGHWMRSRVRLMPRRGYRAWGWALSADHVMQLMHSAGFRVDRQMRDGDTLLMLATAVDTPVCAPLPNIELDALGRAPLALCA